MRKILLLIFFLSVMLYSSTDLNNSNKNNIKDVNKTEVPINRELLIFTTKLETLDKDKDLNNEWTKTYSAYITHQKLLDRQKDIKNKILKLKSLKSLTKKQKKRLAALEKENKILKDKINLIKNFDIDPFKKFIEPPKLDNVPNISNPFAIIGGYSYLKELDNEKQEYINRYDALIQTIQKLKQKQELLSKILKITNSKLDKQHLDIVNKELKKLLTIKDIFSTTKDVYLKKADEVKISIDNSIKREIEKAVKTIVIASIFLFIFIGLKYLTNKYLSDKDSFYTVNKVINIAFITVIIFILLFSYLENVNYLITILGFASAGIAIAMKDWFMSLMGWFVIVIGGAIHVGDRIKVVRGNIEYVGDVVDISMLRMTIYEDITLTTYVHNRRAGRIIFVPNNYIFTDLIANYSHSGLKTVWDGIDFYITFDSNISKATMIAKNIVKQYSKGYTDITRKQLNKLRSKYQLKNTNVEPRIFSFIEGYGMKVSVWYLTNAYATLTLRSTISNKIIEEISREPDIKIAYPTQSFYVNRGVPKPEPIDIEEERDINV